MAANGCSGCPPLHMHQLVRETEHCLLTLRPLLALTGNTGNTYTSDMNEAVI